MSLESYQARRAAQSRAAVLEAAEQGFCRDGYDRTSLARIADEAGVSSATVYKHFPSKRALFEAVLQVLADHASLPVGEGPLSRARVHEYATGYAALLTQQRTLALLRLLITEAAHQPELVQVFYQRLKGPLFAPLHAVLQSHLGGDADRAALAARQLAGMVEGHLMLRQLLEPASHVEDSHVRLVVDAAVETWWSGWGARLS